MKTVTLQFPDGYGSSVKPEKPLITADVYQSLREAVQYMERNAKETSYTNMLRHDAREARKALRVIRLHVRDDK